MPERPVNILKTTAALIAFTLSLQGFAVASPLYNATVGDESTWDAYRQSSYYDLQKGSEEADSGNYAKAVDHFEKAVENNPSSVISQYNLGYSRMQLAEETLSPEQKAENLSEAEWAFLRVRDINPELTLTYYKLGKLAIAREDYKTASEYYESGVIVNPENFALQFNLGATYEKLNDLDKAERAYQNAISANPKFVYAHNNLGLIYEQIGDLEKAESVYRQALAAVPEYNFARLNLGSLLQTQGRLEEAEGIYKDAIEYEPQNAWAHLYLGNTYFRKGLYDQALASYNKSLSLNPDYATTYYLISLTLQKLDRTEEALVRGLQYVNLAPNGAFSQEAGELIMTLKHGKSKAARP